MIKERDELKGKKSSYEEEVVMGDEVWFWL